MAKIDLGDNFFIEEDNEAQKEVAIEEAASENSDEQAVMNQLSSDREDESAETENLEPNIEKTSDEEHVESHIEEDQYEEPLEEDDLGIGIRVNSEDKKQIDEEDDDTVLEEEIEEDNLEDVDIEDDSEETEEEESAPDEPEQEKEEPREPIKKKVQASSTEKNNIEKPITTKRKNNISADEDGVSIHLNRKTKDILVKCGIGIAVLVFFVVIPIAILSILPDKKSELSNNETTKPAVIIDGSTQQNTQVSEDNNNETSSYYSYGGVTDSRFSSIDDLHSYVTSTCSSLFDKEKELTDNYYNGVLDKNTMIEKLNTFNVAYNELSHLLLVNKGNYINNNHSDKYQAAEEQIVKCMVYTDIAIYEVNNKSVEEMKNTLKSFK